LVLLDGYKNVEDLLQTQKVDILKVNAMEIKSLMGKDDLDNCAEDCFSKFGLKYVAITDGSKKAHLFSKEEGKMTHFFYTIPQLEEVVNPIGAGDTCSAVFMIGLLQGISAHESYKRALGAASASCLNMEGANFSLDEMDKITSKIQMEKSQSMK